jgi:hypothetical protein
MQKKAKMNHKLQQIEVLFEERSATQTKLGLASLDW